jgi:carboxypeptidase family protein
MMPSTRRLVITVSLCAGLTTFAETAPQAPPPGTTGAPGLPPRAPATPPPAAKGTAVISGRILAADTGLPLRRARVLIQGSGPNIPPGPNGMLTAITDADGAFSFTELPAGRYHVQASKPRYVDGMLGARRRSSPGRPLELADGQRIENVTLSLARAGAISGRVVDELGEPVAGARVSPLRVVGRETRGLAPQGNSDETDDTGAYRLYGLPPGSYVVSAQDDGMRFGFTMTTASATGFAPTFFPSTAVAADAQAIEVMAGGEAVADISLVTARLTAVSGSVVNAAGAPATGGGIHAFADGGMRGFGGPDAGTMIKPDGTFTLPGLAPGEYVVQARPTFESRGPFPATGAMERHSVSASITVTGDPIPALRLVLPDPIRLPVVARFDGSTAKPPEQVSVSAYSERGRDGSSAMRGPDGRLTLDVAPGSWRISAFAAAPWRLERILYRGEEIESGKDIDLTDEPGGRLEVFFTTRSGTLAGSVKDASGKPVVDYIVFIVPTDDDRPSPSGGWNVSTALPDQVGRFKAERLRPGAYVATAIEEPDSAPGPNFKARLRKAGTPFRVRENETATLDLTLVSLPDSEP